MAWVMRRWAMPQRRAGARDGRARGVPGGRRPAVSHWGARDGARQQVTDFRRCQEIVDAGRRMHETGLSRTRVMWCRAASTSWERHDEPLNRSKEDDTGLMKRSGDAAITMFRSNATEYHLNTRTTVGMERKT
uniref:Uncharacterized protein n=1 Tax=Oryza barthii TaxID=65489 RepID=A0A0D3FRV6_9ORYZ